MNFADLTLNENAQKVSFWLDNLANEFEDIALSPVQSKAKLILLMVYIDIFSQIWWKVKFRTDSNTCNRYTKWLENFVLCDSNRVYVAQKDEFRNLCPDLVYKVRNSLLHLGGLPNLGDRAIFISSKTRRELLDKYFQGTSDSQLVVLCPRILFPAVAIAIAHTIESLSNGETSNSDDETILLDIYSKIEHNLALPIYPK